MAGTTAAHLLGRVDRSSSDRTLPLWYPSYVLRPGTRSPLPYASRGWRTYRHCSTRNPVGTCVEPSASTDGGVGADW